MRVETPSVNYMLFDESSKKLAKQKGKVRKVSEVESKVKEEVHKVSKVESKAKEVKSKKNKRK